MLVIFSSYDCIEGEVGIINVVESKTSFSS